MPGKVYLVGAGPGDPELLTVKGRRVLAEADLVVYDRLANPALLGLTRPEAERVYAGKSSEARTFSQEELTSLLVREGTAGKLVCRLKGGDPFLFGRGGEEAAALSAAGVPWEYVPGVPSALAVPGYAGIPVTHRGMGSSVTVVTGHEDPSKPEGTVNWAGLARVDGTRLFLMSAERISVISQRLIQEGCPGETPAALVQWGTYPHQETIQATLERLPDAVLQRARQRWPEGVGDEPTLLRRFSPAVVVVGAVVELRDRLRWWDAGPLFNRRIAVTRGQEQAHELADELARRGAHPVLCPTIRICPVPDPDLAGLDQPYDWIVFTSANGVRTTLAALADAGHDVRRLGPARLAAIGPGTARVLQEAGLRVAFVPSRAVAEGLLDEFPDRVEGRRILIPRAREAREVLPEQWRAAGATVDVVPVYETVPDGEGIALLQQQLERGELDAITFTAASTVKHLLGSVGADALNSVAVICIGPITEQAAQAGGVRVDAVAEEYTIPGLLRRLEQFFAAKQFEGR